MRKRNVIPSTIVLLLVSCSAPGVLVLHQAGDAAPKMGKAPADGKYRLFINNQSPEEDEFALKKGDPLGFEWANNGAVQWLYAVAGAAKQRLDVTRTYEWRRMQ